MSFDLLGLYLDLKQRRQQEQQFQEQMRRQQDQELNNGFLQAVKLAETGDQKLALSGLSIATKNRYTPEMQTFVEGLAKQVKQQQKAKEQSAELRSRAFGDVARGAAAQLRAGQSPEQFLQQQQALGSLNPELLGPALGRAAAIAQAGEGTQEQALEQLRATTGIQRQSAIQQARETQRIKSADAVFPVRDNETGETSTIIGLENLRAARSQNPNLIVTGKPTAIGESEAVFGKPTRTRFAQLEDDAMYLDNVAADVDETLEIIEKNPALVGFRGSITRGLGGSIQALSELAGTPVGDSILELADEAQRKIAEDSASGRIDPKAARDFTNALTDPGASAIDVLGITLTYGFGRALRGEGKLTVDDKERAEKAIGLRTGMFTSGKQVGDRLRFIRKRLTRQQRTARARLEAAGKKRSGSTGKSATVPKQEYDEVLRDAEAAGIDIDFME